MDATHVIAVLATLLTMSEVFFPFLTPYQGFIDGLIALLSQLGKKIKEPPTVPIETTNVPVLTPILKKNVQFEPSTDS
jgi:hypothetical protein